jgi:regulator of RNase E activity RraA
MTKANVGSDGIAQDLLEKLKTVPPAAIGHLRANGFVDTAIRPTYPLKTVITGLAVTVKMARGDTSLTRAAIEALSPGDILVIDAGGDEQVACWGEMTSLAAKARGAVAVIIDGSVTDTVEIEEHVMPTFSRRISAVVGRRLNLKEGSVNVPVQCGGVVVNPGDVIVADNNGIVVIPPAEAEDVYRAGRSLEDRAPYQKAWLQHGGSLTEITGLGVEDLQAKLKEKGWS